jgi:hypothetical protein
MHFCAQPLTARRVGRRRRTVCAVPAHQALSEGQLPEVRPQDRDYHVELGQARLRPRRVGSRRAPIPAPGAVRVCVRVACAVGRGAPGSVCVRVASERGALRAEGPNQRAQRGARVLSSAPQ